jgi:hypothetical protein
MGDTSGISRACGQGTLLIFQDVLFRTIEHVAIFGLEPLDKQMESPML